MDFDEEKVDNKEKNQILMELSRWQLMNYDSVIEPKT